MKFAKIIYRVSRARFFRQYGPACVLSSIDIWRFAKVACFSSPSPSLFFSLCLNTYVLSLSTSRPHLFLLCSPSASRAACTHTYVCTYLPTFNDRYAFNCSPSPSPPRGRARDFPTSRATRSATIFSAARYRRTWHWGLPERERELQRNATRGVSRRRYRRYRDVAMRRAAPRRGVDQLASLRLSPSAAASAACTAPPPLCSVVRVHTTEC